MSATKGTLMGNDKNRQRILYLTPNRYISSSTRDGCMYFVRPYRSFKATGKSLTMMSDAQTGSYKTYEEESFSLNSNCSNSKQVREFFEAFPFPHSAFVEEELGPAEAHLTWIFTCKLQSAAILIIELPLFFRKLAIERYFTSVDPRSLVVMHERKIVFFSPMRTLYHAPVKHRYRSSIC